MTGLACETGIETRIAACPDLWKNSDDQAAEQVPSEEACRHMKSISASIVVLAGVACLHVATEYPRADSFSAYTIVTGTLVIICGMFGWFRSLMNPQ
jgi:hypothetical protein